MPRPFARGLAATVTMLAALAAFPAATGAQSSAASFCAARESVGPNSGKAEMAAGLKTIANTAEGAAQVPAAALLTLFEKKGMKAFDGDKAFQLLAALDEHYFDTCPATKLDVTATDFTFAGVPASLPAGPAAVRLANRAPSEAHELILVKLTPAGEARDILELLPMSDKKIAKFVDFDTAGFTFAEAGETGYGLVELEPGSYLYACFVNEGGTKKGTPHWEHGMYGTFEVE